MRDIVLSVAKTVVTTRKHVKITRHLVTAVRRIVPIQQENTVPIVMNTVMKKAMLTAKSAVITVVQTQEKFVILATNT